MKLSYEFTFDHWIAAQLFDVEQRSSLKKLDNKTFFRLFTMFVLLDIFIYFNVDPNDVFRLLTIFIACWVPYHLVFRHILMRKLICRRLKVAYGQEFENEKDKTVHLDITPENIVLRSSKCESRYGIDAIRKITICPQYLFIDLGFASRTTIPKQAVSQADYNSFSAYLINLYQTYATKHQQEANIVQSNWTIDLSVLSKKVSAKTSLKRWFFMFLWWIVFFTVGILLFGMLAFSLVLFQSFTGILPFDETALSHVAAGGLLIGSAALGFVGLFLGLFGRLPGTR